MCSKEDLEEVRLAYVKCQAEPDETHSVFPLGGVGQADQRGFNRFSLQLYKIHFY